jgi:hypothetical protein
MRNQDSRQLELFADGARGRGACPIEERLRAKLGGARQLLREIVVLGMKSWLPEETRQGLREAEAFRREQVRVHHRILEQFRARQRRPVYGGSTCRGLL